MYIGEYHSTWILSSKNVDDFVESMLYHQSQSTQPILTYGRSKVGVEVQLLVAKLPYALSTVCAYVATLRYAYLRWPTLKSWRRLHSSRGAAELVLESDWPPLALLGSVGEWGDEGTNPNEERRFIVNRIHVATARRSRN